MLDEIIARRTFYEAFARVRENGGCRGADGVTLQDFAANLEVELDSLQDRLLRRRYHPFPLLRFEVPKSGDRVRYLSVPTVRDRVLQTAVYLVTREVFEAEFEECSYAYREGRSVRHAVRRIDELRRQGFRWVDRQTAAEPPPRPHPLSPSPIALPPTGRGGTIPNRSSQKGSLHASRRSPVNLGKAARTGPPSPGGREGDGRGGQGVRFPGGGLVENNLLEELGLALNREKTRITSFEHGFKFLGAVFLNDAIYLPFDRPKKKQVTPWLPPPLDLLTYLELRNREE